MKLQKLDQARRFVRSEHTLPEDVDAIYNKITIRLLKLARVAAVKLQKTSTEDTKTQAQNLQKGEN